MGDRIVPPRIPNAEYVNHLGSGGFADVFLYRQRMPERDIAVKVLRGDADVDQNRAFEAEANLMARMSSHPSILSVFGAGVTEDGRSYLVMEYCPPPNMGQRARQHQITVPRVLDMGIRISGAVETLHRAGILHRDIKPANILVTQFGHPVLTDFGIAVSTGPDGDRGDSGFSVPWAPPEQQTGAGPFGPAMDVYSLAATVYTLLTGRSPFEVVGADNREIAMLNRVLRSPVPRTGRADVPVELERILSIAMSKDPGQRYASALDFAHALQQVQVDMHQRSTPVDVLDEAPPEDLDDDEDDATRVRSLAMIDPDGPPTGAGPTRDARGVLTPEDDGTRRVVRSVDPSAQPRAGSATEWTVSDRTRASSSGVRHGSTPEVPAYTSGGPHAAPVASAPPAPPLPGGPPVEVGTPSSPVPDVDEGGKGSKRIGAVLAGTLVAVVVLALAGFGVWSYLRGEGGSEAPSPTAPATAPAGLPVASSGTGIAGLSGTVEGSTVVFSWEPSGSGDETYLYRVVDPLENHQVRETKDTTVSVDPVQGRTCLEVVRRDADGKTTPPTTQCVETP